MARGAIEALRADREALLAIGARLSDDDWRAEAVVPAGRSRTSWPTWGPCSGRWSTRPPCPTPPGWPPSPPRTSSPTPGDPAPPPGRVRREARGSGPAADVLADYESVSTEALERLAALESQDFELALGDLGNYPAFVLPNAFSFDHY